MKPFQNLTEQRYGRLTVIRQAASRGYCKRWDCLCDCGMIVTVYGGALRKGATKSCGCLQRDNRFRHGMAVRGSQTSTHATWLAMKQRCLNPNSASYHKYGGRGITVCARWLESFQNFLVDMGERPKGLSLERKDNNAGYAPDNCRWATPAEQSLNTRRNINIEFRGRVQPRKQWAKEFNVNHETLRHRLNRGWSIERALLTPPLAPYYKHRTNGAANSNHQST